MKYVIEYVYVSLVGLPSELMEIAVVEAESREHATTIADGTGDFVLEQYLLARSASPGVNDIYDVRVNPLMQWSKMRFDLGRVITEACDAPPAVTEQSPDEPVTIGDLGPSASEIHDIPPELLGQT